jgi:hypothetical protein
MSNLSPAQKSSPAHILFVCAIICCAFLLVFAVIAGCKLLLSRIRIPESWNPQGDWIYDLPNGYQMWHFSLSSNELVAPDGRYHFVTDTGETGATSHAVGQYITCFCYGERYVAVRHVDNMLDDYEKLVYEEEDYEQKRDQAAYYLVDTESTDIFGPFATEEEFLAKCEEVGVSDLCDWISTATKPAGAHN